MIIYEAEKEIAHLLEQNSSVAFYVKLEQMCDQKEMIQAKASFEELLKLGLDIRNDKDLYYNKSILVSTGWNLNDDVFDPVEAWKARHTPEDKPSNLNHNEKEIVGHITGNWAIDEAGNIIPDNTPIDQLPEHFHLFTSNVIYLHWEDAEYQQKVIELVKAIEEGNKYVSMECLFPTFDYAMEYPNGEYKVLAREHSTAYLTKHLRRYGGSGFYGDIKLGRVLRDISFSGKGYVDKPANPESIIFSETDFKKFANAKILEKNQFSENSGVSTIRTHSSNWSKIEMDELKKLQEQVQQLTTALETEKANSATLSAQLKEVAEDKIAALENKLSDALAAKDEYVKKSTEKEDELKKSKSDLEEALAKVETLEKQIAESMKKEKMMKRKAELVQAGVSDEEADKTIAKFENLSDEDFSFIVELSGRASKKEVEKPAETTEAQVTEETIEEVETEELSLATASEEVNETEEIRKALAEVFDKTLSKSK